MSHETGKEELKTNGVYEMPQRNGSISNQNEGHFQETKIEKPSVENEGIGKDGYSEGTSAEHEFERLPLRETRFTLFVNNISMKVRSSWKHYGHIILLILTVLLAIAFAAYFIYAMTYEFGSEKSVRLLWMTLLAVFVRSVKICLKYIGDDVSKFMQRKVAANSKRLSFFLWVTLAVLYLFVIIFVIVDATVMTQRYYNLVSLCGTVFYVVTYFITSNNPAYVNWRAVGWGVALQFIFGIVILRWDVGYAVFQWLGDRVTIFLDNASAGSIFLFGEGYREHYFAFAVLAKIIFFSTCIAILYHLGFMQWLVKWTGFFLQTVLSTSAVESLNAAGNVFFGQSEVSFIIKPFIGDMTPSELHAVMTAGMATVSGSLMAGYIQFGAEAHHLIAASVMSAPAALAISKLRYPEEYVSKTTAKDVADMPPSQDRNVIEAASNGACNSVKLISFIAVNVLAFTSVLSFVDQTLSWFGDRIGFKDTFEEPLSFGWICSYLLFPLPLIMGVPFEDCRQVAKLFGIKVFTTAFIAYKELGDLMDNRKEFEKYKTYPNATWHETLGGLELGEIPGVYTATILKGGVMGVSGIALRMLDNVLIYFLKPNTEERSEVIATYSLCGLGDIGVMGILLGLFGGMAPHRKHDLARLVVSAMLAGNVASFMTACVAGLFYQEGSLEP